MVKYISVEWPEYQYFMDHPRFRDECYYCPDASIYFIPEDLYEEVTYKLQFPKKYENTNLGTIVCYETRAVVNGDKSYWYDESDIRKGDIALIYDKNRNWHTSKIVTCSKGLPIILEDSEFVIGINCELIGHYNPEIPFKYD